MSNLRVCKAERPRRALAIALGSVHLAWALCATAGPEDAHGFVEPCQVGFVADSKQSCEPCVPVKEDPERCQLTFGARGYVRKCRSGPHSPPGEVWCIAKSPKSRASSPSWLPWLAGVGGLGVALTAFLRWRKRRTASGSSVDG